MTWAWVGTVWIVALFVLGVVMAIVMLSVLVILVAYTVQTIREGLRSAREKREDATNTPAPATAPRTPSAISRPAPDNVVSIMRHEDQ